MASYYTSGPDGNDRSPFLPSDPPGESSPVSWDRLCELEPRLQPFADALTAWAGLAAGRRPFCANEVWLGHGRPTSFRDAVAALVGWDRADRHPDPAADRVLRSSDAYDLACDRLYDLLPDCNGCWCLSPADFDTVRGATA